MTCVPTNGVKLVLKTAILKGRPYSTLRAPGCSRGRGPPCSLPQCSASGIHQEGQEKALGCGRIAAGLGLADLSVG